MVASRSASLRLESTCLEYLARIWIDFNLFINRIKYSYNTTLDHIEIFIYGFEIKLDIVIALKWRTYFYKKKNCKLFDNILKLYQKARNNFKNDEIINHPLSSQLHKFVMKDLIIKHTQKYLQLNKHWTFYSSELLLSTIDPLPAHNFLPPWIWVENLTVSSYPAQLWLISL